MFHKINLGKKSGYFVKLYLLMNYLHKIITNDNPFKKNHSLFVIDTFTKNEIMKCSPMNY